jgi:hypothetical protein
MIFYPGEEIQEGPDKGKRSIEVPPPHPFWMVKPQKLKNGWHLWPDH